MLFYLFTLHKSKTKQLSNMKSEILKSIWDKCFKKGGDKTQELGILKITFLETNMIWLVDFTCMVHSSKSKERHLWDVDQGI